MNRGFIRIKVNGKGDTAAEYVEWRFVIRNSC